jgi:hypothetical protein
LSERQSHGKEAETQGAKSGRAAEVRPEGRDQGTLAQGAAHIPPGASMGTSTEKDIDNGAKRSKEANPEKR